MNTATSSNNEINGESDDVFFHAMNDVKFNGYKIKGIVIRRQFDEEKESVGNSILGVEKR